MSPRLACSAGSRYSQKKIALHSSGSTRSWTSKVGLTNTYWGVLLPSLVSPFGVYLSRVYAAASVPDELLEAARIDGSGEVRTFFTLSVRLMAPAFVTIFLFHFVAVWNNFLLPLIMLGNQNLFPVTLGLY